MTNKNETRRPMILHFNNANTGVVHRLLRTGTTVNGTETWGILRQRSKDAWESLASFDIHEGASEDSFKIKIYDTLVAAGMNLTEA